MVRYEKNFTPLCLVDETREKAFQKNIKEKKYNSNNDTYKCKNGNINQIANHLKKIYKNKCAYCETKFNRSYIKIEHYRPKNSRYYKNYYFLAYSWSNLLPICDICNNTKLDYFDIEDNENRIIYNNETLKDIQYNTKKYNKIEKPLFIHPEYDEYDKLFSFNNKGKMVTFDKRLRYTRTKANLNEKYLKDRRATVINDFRNLIDESIFLFRFLETKEDFIEFKYMIENKIKDFFIDENEFIAVRKFIIQRLDYCLVDSKFNKMFKISLYRYIKDIEVYSSVKKGIIKL